jgi:hypothetical protein
MSMAMQKHLQNLLSQELMTCLVPEDPACPIPIGGYVVPCVVFYERGFGVPSHQFLRSLL